MTKIRPIAIHLPQFHPFPENDEWWGKGFTEWTNVTKAKPLFQGHYQPHLPADLGFYDLRLEEARLAQETLAKEHGIYGFCYYHYWFNGKRLMYEPLDRKLKNAKEDLPFMLCWANENWTRAWDGAEKHVLIGQQYSPQDDFDHIQYLLKFFQDPRYIRIDNKPVIAIYKSADLPCPHDTLKIWRDEARKVGLELYICRMDRWNTLNGQSVLDMGFDSSIDFQPLSPNLRNYLKEKDLEERELINKSIWRRLKRKVSNLSRSIFPDLFIDKNKKITHIIDYEHYVDYDLNHLEVDYKRFPCVSPSWDNSARRKFDATIFINSQPKVFEKWVKGKKGSFNHFTSEEENLFFINAWNEWAEGNHLEPCQEFGEEYLKAFKRGIDG